MRFYSINLSDIVSAENDSKFAKYIVDNNFEFWRYTALTYIIATPDSVSTNQIITELIKAYGAILFLVLEININDVGGISPQSFKDAGVNPFAWFHEIRQKSYVPKWEKVKSKV